jgi:hypothetical protein
MTRKDYQALAKALREELDEATDGFQWANCVHAVAAVLRADNPRFDKPKFMDACGWETFCGTPFPKN